MPASNTYFEQIPVETVKKIATELPDNDAIGNESAGVEAQDEVASSQKRWRQVAQEVQQEKDPKRMIGLVHQLIAKLDEEQLRKRPPLTKDTRNPSGSSET
jgi:hypothetical protein